MTEPESVDLETAESARRPRRGHAREARRAARLGPALERVPFLMRKLKPYEVLSEEGLALIEHNADTVLEEVGIEFRGEPDLLELWRQAGADVQGERVRIPRGLCRSIIQATAPREFTQYARNPANNVVIGGDNTVFVPSYGSPFIHNLDEGRRYATLEDFRNFVKLAYMSPYLHHSGGTLVEPTDLPVNKRHLDMVYSHIRYSDKAFMGSVTAGERAEDSVAMAKLVFGDEFVERNCVLISIINTNSPLVLDHTMLAALKVYASHNQCCIITPFILAGAMGPVSEVGAVTQLFAEAQAGIAVTQLVRPGAPVIFGSFTSSMSLLSGAPTFGTAEANLALLAAGQLARRLGVPYRAGGHLCASKLPDGQAIQESCDSMMCSILSGVNLMMHCAGWLEGGLAMGYEKFVIDHDHLGMMMKFAGGLDLSENAQALDAIREVGPGKHFLGCAHTRANYETAFYNAKLADNNSYEQWLAEGGLDIAQRANKVWKKMLAEYRMPALDPAIDEALQDFIARRKASMPDALG
ncbi:MAG TPA: trimethylamine methyltransferase family protein [Candidatus Competibacteraceae bacterium]|nr:trimethylamine methyltransferase family protein [Candidatus Competibacteraceae bacterium]